MKHLYRWYVLLACSLIFAVGGTMACLASIILSGMPVWCLTSLAIGAGLLVASGLSLQEMERC